MVGPRGWLARADPIATLSMVAIPVGLAVGLVVIGFRWLSEAFPVWLGLLPAIERYEALSPASRFALPLAGAVVIGLVFQALPQAMRATGPVHVLAGLAGPGSRLPWANAVVQFLAGAVAIISGQSVGREGPVIHLGATAASRIGARLGLPADSGRTLVASGVAAAIAGCYNTPLAGVVFAMEVIVLGYSLLGFAPVILAAVSATWLSRLVYGDHAAFVLPPTRLVSSLELPWILLLGVVIGVLAVSYVAGIVRLDRATRRWPIALRMTAGGVVAGLVGVFVPEVMGLGYDTIGDALAGRLGLATLALIAVAKLVATIGCGGFALPGGLIGPMLVIGACAGGAIGQVGADFVPALAAPHGFYATLGAVAMMGACLQAPLAALTAILELTANPNIILPGLVAVMAAFVVIRIGAGLAPLFVAILSDRAQDGVQDRADDRPRRSD